MHKICTSNRKNLFQNHKYGFHNISETTDLTFFPPQVGKLLTPRTGHGCAIVHVNYVPHLVVAGGMTIGPHEMPLLLRQNIKKFIKPTPLLFVY